MISVRIVVAYLVGPMGDVKLDRAPATRLEVYEQQPVLGPKQIAGVRLAMQQLLGGATVDDRPPQASQCATEKLTVGVSKRGRVVAAPN